VGAGRVSRPAAWLSAAAAAAAVAAVAAVALVGCGSASGPDAGSGSGSGSGTVRHGGQIPSSLAAAARPIGSGPRFHPAARGGRVPGRCAPRLDRRDGVHVELFAADRVVLLAPGIGVGRPWRVVGGRITRARCYGALATIDPTGVVLVRPGARLTVGDLFGAWGRSLGTRRLLSFHARWRVRAYVDGRRWTRTAPAAIPLTRHAEIVLELGPYVPPHRSFAFPRDE
jgi:hypothetical protein